MDSYAKMTQKRVLLYLLLSFVLNCIPLLKKAPKSFFKNGLRKNPSSFIYPSESPVFIGVSGAKWHKSTLHRLSFPVIFCHSNCFQFVMNTLP